MRGTGDDTSEARGLRARAGGAVASCQPSCARCVRRRSCPLGREAVVLTRGTPYILANVPVVVARDSRGDVLGTAVAVAHVLRAADEDVGVDAGVRLQTAEDAVGLTVDMADVVAVEAAGRAAG